MTDECDAILTAGTWPGPQSTSVGAARSLRLLLMLSIAGLAAFESFRFLDWNFDDSYIVFRVAGNIADGHGWCFNVGEVKNPSTSALNTILFAIAASFTRNVPLAAHFFGYVWIAGAGLILAAIIFRLFGSGLLGAVLSWFSGCVLVLTLSNNSTWGIELHLFCFVLFLYILLDLYGKDTWPIIGIAVLVRPDAAALIPIKCLLDTWQNRKIPLSGIAKCLLIIAPWLIYSWMTFGSAFPNTLSQKMWQGQSGLWGVGSIYSLGLFFFLFKSGTAQLLLTLFALVCSIVMIMRVARYRDHAARERSPIAVVAAIVFVVVQQSVYVAINVPPYHWYYATIEAVMVMVACIGLGNVLVLLEERLHTRINLRLFQSASVLLLITGAVALTMQYGLAAVSDPRDRAYRNASARLMNQPVGDTIGIVEAGTVGYLTGRHILDLTGLTTDNPEFITGKNNDRFFNNPPTVLAFREPPRPMEKALLSDRRFAHLYVLVESVSDPDIAFHIYRRNDRQ
jgi:hypothetical protein